MFSFKLICTEMTGSLKVTSYFHLSFNNYLHIKSVTRNFIIRVCCLSSKNYNKNFQYYLYY